MINLLLKRKLFLILLILFPVFESCWVLYTDTPNGNRVQKSGKYRFKNANSELDASSFIDTNAVYIYKKHSYIRVLKFFSNGKVFTNLITEKELKAKEVCICDGAAGYYKIKKGNIVIEVVAELYFGTYDYSTYEKSGKDLVFIRSNIDGKRDRTEIYKWTPEIKVWGKPDW